VQGHYGERDDFYPADDARAQAEQIRAESGAEVEFHFYDAGHAFHNDTNKLGTYSEPTPSWAGRATVGVPARRWSEQGPCRGGADRLRPARRAPGYSARDPAVVLFFLAAAGPTRALRRPGPTSRRRLGQPLLLRRQAASSSSVGRPAARAFSSFCSSSTTFSRSLARRATRRSS
jgi:hypothetical protein